MSEPFEIEEKYKPIKKDCDDCSIRNKLRTGNRIKLYGKANNINGKRYYLQRVDFGYGYSMISGIDEVKNVDDDYDHKYIIFIVEEVNDETTDNLRFKLITDTGEPIQILRYWTDKVIASVPGYVPVGYFEDSCETNNSKDTCLPIPDFGIFHRGVELKYDNKVLKTGENWMTSWIYDAIFEAYIEDQSGEFYLNLVNFYSDADCEINSYSTPLRSQDYEEFTKREKNQSFLQFNWINRVKKPILQVRKCLAKNCKKFQGEIFPRTKFGCAIVPNFKIDLKKYTPIKKNSNDNIVRNRLRHGNRIKIYGKANIDKKTYYLQRVDFHYGFSMISGIDEVKNVDDDPVNEYITFTVEEIDDETTDNLRFKLIMDTGDPIQILRYWVDKIVKSLPVIEDNFPGDYYDTCELSHTKDTCLPIPDLGRFNRSVKLTANGREVYTGADWIKSWIYDAIFEAYVEDESGGFYLNLVNIYSYADCEIDSRSTPVVGLYIDPYKEFTQREKNQSFLQFNWINKVKRPILQVRKSTKRYNPNERSINKFANILPRTKFKCQVIYESDCIGFTCLVPECINVIDKSTTVQNELVNLAKEHPGEVITNPSLQGAVDKEIPSVSGEIDSIMIEYCQTEEGKENEGCCYLNSSIYPFSTFDKTCSKDAYKDETLRKPMNIQCLSILDASAGEKAIIDKNTVIQNCEAYWSEEQKREFLEEDDEGDKGNGGILPPVPTKTKKTDFTTYMAIGLLIIVIMLNFKKK